MNGNHFYNDVVEARQSLWLGFRQARCSMEHVHILTNTCMDIQSNKKICQPKCSQFFQIGF